MSENIYTELELLMREFPELVQAYETNAAVHDCISLARARDMPIREMLVLCVKALTAQNAELFKRLNEATAMSLPSLIVVNAV